MTRQNWPAEVDRGISFANWTPEGYATDQAADSLAQLAATGATDVAIVVTAYVQDLNDSVVVARPSRTPTIESVRRAIETAQGLGLRTILKPHVDIVGGGYRGGISPAKPEDWFTSYRDFLLPWAELAESTGSRSFWVGTELEGTTAWLDRWNVLLEAVRAVFGGSLLYAANWLDLELDGTLALGRMVDLVGVDAYFPIAVCPDPSAGELIQGWQPWVALLERFAHRTAKPLVITEVGCMSRAGGAMSPWSFSSNAPLDLGHQATYYEATLTVLPSVERVRGMFFWAWGLGRGGSSDGSHTPRGKPAEQVLRRFWANEADP